MTAQLVLLLPAGTYLLSINLTDQVGLQRRFNSLAVDAEVLLPLGAAAWSKCYGLLTDQYGLTWLFNLDTADGQR